MNTNSGVYSRTQDRNLCLEPDQHPLEPKNLMKTIDFTDPVGVTKSTNPPPPCIRLCTNNLTRPTSAKIKRKIN